MNFAQATTAPVAIARRNDRFNRYSALSSGRHVRHIPYQDLDDAPSHFLREVEHFFSAYKQLEGVIVEPQNWLNRQAAMEEVRRSIARGQD